jgi:hypothetical protein
MKKTFVIAMLALATSAAVYGGSTKKKDKPKEKAKTECCDKSQCCPKPPAGCCSKKC